MVRTTIVLSDGVHKELKIYSVKINKSISKIVNELVVSMLNKSKGEKE